MIRKFCGNLQANIKKFLNRQFLKNFAGNFNYNLKKKIEKICTYSKNLRKLKSKCQGNFETDNFFVNWDRVFPKFWE